MKKRKYLFFLLCFLGTTLCWAQTVNLTKSTMKSYKNECKKLKKDGWKVYENAASVDEAMMEYYCQMEAGGNDVMTVTGIGQDMNVNTAYRQARHRASVALTSQKGVHIESQTTVRMTNSSEGSSSETHTMNYARAEQIIRGQKPVASLYRKRADGTTEINLYYIIVISSTNR